MYLDKILILNLEPRYSMIRPQPPPPPLLDHLSNQQRQE